MKNRSEYSLNTAFFFHVADTEYSIILTILQTNPLWRHKTNIPGLHHRSIFAFPCWSRRCQQRAAQHHLLDGDGGPRQCSSLDQIKFRSHQPVTRSLSLSDLSHVLRKACLYSLQWGTCSSNGYHSQQRWAAHDPMRGAQPPKFHFRTGREYKHTVPCSTAAMETPCWMGVGAWVTWSPKG